MSKKISFQIFLSDLLNRNRIKIIVRTYSKWLKKGEKVLDVGCGDGLLTYNLASKLHLNITGCDLGNYILKKVPFKIMTDESHLPFPRNSFDAVIFSDVLHHTSKINQEKLLAEALRVTQKYIIINEAKPTFVAFIFDFILNKISNLAVDVPLTFRQKKQWLSLFRKLPVKVHTENVTRPQFSVFSHFVFLLKVLPKKLK